MPVDAISTPKSWIELPIFQHKSNEPHNKTMNKT